MSGRIDRAVGWAHDVIVKLLTDADEQLAECPDAEELPPYAGAPGSVRASLAGAQHQQVQGTR